MVLFGQKKAPKAAIHPKKITTHQFQSIFKINQKITKPFTGLICMQSRLMATTHYCKKYGIMCCIVLKCYYLCDVIEKHRINLSPQSIAMNKQIFSQRSSQQPLLQRGYKSEVKLTKP
jgi:hypothetical protein